MCLVAWPAKLMARGEVRRQYVHAVDVVPTLYELLDIEPSSVLKGYPQNPIEGESFAASLTEPTVPGKQTQFYAMLGQRSIYHDGWLACTVHPPLSGWGAFAHDRWELYNLTEDRAQSRNVAAQEPKQLETLKSLWYYYAGRYNGLPLDDRTALEQTLAERPHGTPPRERYVYYPDCASVPEQSGVVISGRSYTIAAAVDMDSADAEGVVYAHGGIAGGHSLYVKNRRLRYAFNWVGTRDAQRDGERDHPAEESHPRDVFLHHEKPEDHGGEAARPEPPDVADCGKGQAGSGQGEGDGQHPDHGEAQHGVGDDPPVEVLQSRTEQDGAEDHKAQGGEQLGETLGEVGGVFGGGRCVRCRALPQRDAEGEGQPLGLRCQGA